MGKRLFNKFLSVHYRLYRDLDEGMQTAVKRELHLLNARRAKYMLIATLLFELVLMLFVDLPALAQRNAGREHAMGYLLLHSVIFIAAGFGLGVAYLQLGDKRRLSSGMGVDILLGSVIFVIIAAVAMINGFDQSFSGSIAIYVSITLMLSVLILIPPPVNFIAFTAAHIVFVISMIIFQDDMTARSSNLINGTIVIISSIVISTVFYSSNFESLLKSVQLEIANQRLETLSRTDSLTGLANRRYFYSAIDRMAAGVGGRGTCYLIMFDLDNFKQANDSFGHTLGDLALKQFAQLLKEIFHSGDIAVRWGGEEFLLLFCSGSREEAVAAAGKVLKRQAATPVVYGEKETVLSVSAGIAVLDSYAMDAVDAAIARADEALYAAKKAGRNRCFCSWELG